MAKNPDDTFVDATGTTPKMGIRNEAVAAIRAALQSDERVLLIEKQINDGCSLQEIERAFDGTKWRFHLYKSGLGINIADVEDLHQAYTDQLDHLKSMCSQLVVQGKKLSKPWQSLSQTRIRTKVARQARQVRLTEANVNRLLHMGERINVDGKDPIADLLKTFGFEWLGGDLVFELGSGRRPYYRASIEKGEVAVPSGPLQFRAEAQKVLAALVSAGNSNNERKVVSKLTQALHLGVALNEIASSLAETEYRYEVFSGGAAVTVQNLDDLNHSFTAHCGEVFKLKMMLGVGVPNADLGFRSLNIREPLGFACKALAIEADRLNRYLLPSEPHLEARDYVAEFLSGSDFHWNGEYEVERFDGENERLLVVAITYYNAPPAGPQSGIH